LRLLADTKRWLGTYLLATISSDRNIICIWVSSARCGRSLIERIVCRRVVLVLNPIDKGVACFFVCRLTIVKRLKKMVSASSHTGGWVGVPEYTKLHWNRQGMTETQRLYSVMRQNMHSINRHGSGKFSPSRSSPDT
jgi:hypothetical protein